MNVKDLNGQGGNMVSMIRNFFKMEAAGGLLLLATAILAIITVNSPLSNFYNEILHVHFKVQLGDYKLDMGLHHWINDALMAVFFLLVGMEIKREMQEGELSSFSQVVLPAIAAIGGMAVPALIFVAFNMGDAESIKGWAIPSATDIAFSLGILSLCGSRVPLSLKMFLTALAIFDDLGAIVIIALFYSGDLSITALAGSAVVIGMLVAMNFAKVRSLVPYLALGTVLWGFVLASGIHATIAGVVLGFCIPGKGAGDHHTPLKTLEHAIHPYVVFGILPIFGFANAGVDLSGLSLASLMHPVALGVCLGLFIGKQVGIFGASWLAIKSGLVEMPRKSDWLSLYGVCVLAGIGFTMSLFVGNLAYGASPLMESSKVGVLLGSFLSGIVGFYLVKLGIKDANVTEYFNDKKNDLKILVAEDSGTSHSKKLSDALTEEGYEVEVGANPEQIIQLAKDKEFDLIFLDLDMPIQDYLASLEQLREAVKGSDSFVPIFAASSDSKDGQAKEGFDGYFNKGSIKREELLKEIEEIALHS